nr:hypothetical protein [Pseudomonas aeruginosa]
MDQFQLEVLRAEAIAADRSFSKGRLRDEFRMKPKPDATPVAHYKNGYGGTARLLPPPPSKFGRRPYLH